MKRVTWSKTPPTKPGCYWAFLNEMLGQSVHAVDVVLCGDGVLRVQAPYFYRCAKPLDYFSAWSGPLDVPVMPEGNFRKGLYRFEHDD
jgi:hypothetical protein